MLGIGFFEILIIALVCFIAIGPKQLPAVMRKAAQFYRQFIALRDEFKFQILSADDDGGDPISRKVEPKGEINEKPVEVVPRGKDHG